MLNKNITIFIFQIIKSLIKDNMYRANAMNRFLKYFMMLLTLVLIVVPVILSSICIKLLKVQCKPHTINLIRSVNQTYVKEK